MKIIATDFDGTLRRGPDVTAEDRAAIARWREHGNLFGIVTGREISSIKRELEKCRVDFDFLIVNNGTQIFDADTELYGVRRDGSLLPDISDFIRDNGGLICGVSHDGVYEQLFGEQCPEPNVEAFSRIRFFNQVNTYFHTDAEAGAFSVKVNTAFSGVFNAYQNGRCVDIPPYGISKATGVTEYMKLMRVDKRDLITVGDNFNDLDMIREFCGVAVENAVDEIKAAAGCVAADFTQIIEIFGL